MKKICGIYSLMSPSGKRYIGQSVNIPKRINRYKNLNCSKQTKVYRSLLKYGFDSFLVQILIECRKEELDEYEKLYILTYDSIRNGYNCTAGGEGFCYGKDNPSWKGGISLDKDQIKKSGKKYNDDNKEKIKIQKREYYKINKEKILLRTKEYQILNKEKTDRDKKEYRIKNIEKQRKYQKNRYNEKKIIKDALK